MDNQVNSNESLNEEFYLANSKFESSDELVKSVRAFYCTKGYALSIRNSRKDKFVIFKCDRGGSFRDTRCIETSTSTRLIECPFKIVGKKGNDAAWGFHVKDLTHNHEPSSDISGHPSLRRLPPDKIQTVKEMTLSGIPPRQIISSLRQQNPNLLATSRTIYNLKAKIRKDALGNRSMISALFEELENGGFSYDVLYDSKGHITSLFIAHPLSIKLTNVFSNTFVMDCTYKTNKYNMPLLDIIGVSCFNTTFYSGFAFLEKENEDSYIWALSVFKKILGLENIPFVIMSDRELALMNAIKYVFPTTTSLLCVWHIEKNVLANCKKYFGPGEDFEMFMSQWNSIIYSTTVPIFEEKWVDFESFYIDKKDAIDYIKNTWFPWKEKFVSAWTDNYLHFGTRSSSRVEGAHAKLKLYLQVSTGGFQEVKDKICLAVEHEFNEIKVQLASERIKVPHNCNKPIYRELLSHVSKFALNEIHKQFQRIKKGTLNPCTGHFMATMGIPCAHKLEELHGMTLSLELIHPQWRMDMLSLNAEDDLPSDDNIVFASLLDELNAMSKIWPLNKKEFATSMIAKLLNKSDTFFEPIIQRPKGRPPKSKRKRGATSTTRDPSRFELLGSSQTNNPPNSTYAFQSNNEVIDEFGYINHDNLLDLNDPYMFLE